MNSLSSFLALIKCSFSIFRMVSWKPARSLYKFVAFHWNKCIFYVELNNTDLSAINSKGELKFSPGRFRFLYRNLDHNLLFRTVKWRLSTKIRQKRISLHYFSIFFGRLCEVGTYVYGRNLLFKYTIVDHSVGFVSGTLLHSFTFFHIQVLLTWPICRFNSSVFGLLIGFSKPHSPILKIHEMQRKMEKFQKKRTFL